MQKDSVSMSDDRQPFHRVDGETLTQLQWQEKLRNAVDLFEAFKRAAYLDHTL